MRSKEELAAMKAAQNEVLAAIDAQNAAGNAMKPTVTKKEKKAKKVAAPAPAPEVQNEVPEPVAQLEVTAAPAPVVVKDAAPRWARDLNGQTFGDVKIIRYDYELSAAKGKTHSVAICPFCQKEFSARSWSLSRGKKLHCGCQRKKKEVEVPLSEVTEILNETHVEVNAEEVAAIL